MSVKTLAVAVLAFITLGCSSSEPTVSFEDVPVTQPTPAEVDTGNAVDETSPGPEVTPEEDGNQDDPFAGITDENELNSIDEAASSERDPLPTDLGDSFCAVAETYQTFLVGIFDAGSKEATQGYFETNRDLAIALDQYAPDAGKEFTTPLAEANTKMAEEFAARDWDMAEFAAGIPDWYLPYYDASQLANAGLTPFIEAECQ